MGSDVDLMGLAREAARAGAEQLLAVRDRPLGVEEKSASGDFVSDADRASEEAIVALLSAARPDDGVLGEEGTERPARSDIRWVIDPLDGTTNYLYGLPGWSVSIAAQRLVDGDWDTIAGVVFHPLSGELFEAAAGRGAWRSGRRLHVNDPVPIERALIGTGFSYDRAIRRQQGRVAGFVLPRVRDLRRIGSAALDLAFVGAGALDGFYEGQLALWDQAAGVLIASEAGAVVTPFQDGVAAAGPTLHPSLLELLGNAEQVRDA